MIERLRQYIKRSKNIQLCIVVSCDWSLGTWCKMELCKQPIITLYHQLQRLSHQPGIIWGYYQYWIWSPGHHCPWYHNTHTWTQLSAWEHQSGASYYLKSNLKILKLAHGHKKSPQWKVFLDNSWGGRGDMLFIYSCFTFYWFLFSLWHVLNTGAISQRCTSISWSSSGMTLSSPTSINCSLTPRTNILCHGDKILWFYFESSDWQYLPIIWVPFGN